MDPRKLKNPVVTSDGWKEKDEVDEMQTIITSPCMVCREDIEGTYGGLSMISPICLSCRALSVRERNRRGGE